MQSSGCFKAIVSFKHQRNKEVECCSYTLYTNVFNLLIGPETILLFLYAKLRLCFELRFCFDFDIK